MPTGATVTGVDGIAGTAVIVAAGITTVGMTIAAETAATTGYYWVHDYDRGDAILASVATGAIIGLVVGALAYD